MKKQQLKALKSTSVGRKHKIRYFFFERNELYCIGTEIYFI